MANKLHKNRREFLKKGLALGIATGGAMLLEDTNWLFANQSSLQKPDLVAIKNGEPVEMFGKAMELMGGMQHYVKKGQTVVVKPNIGFPKGPEMAANTNPQLVQSVVEHCYQAGAKKVFVFDHPVDDNCASTYKHSGIGAAVKDAGGIMVPGDEKRYFEWVKIPGGKTIVDVKVHKQILTSDVFINMPILKNHGWTTMTCAMKNLMGAVLDRETYHVYGLDQCIAEFCLFKKPDLNIVDAYRIMARNGPHGISKNDAVLAKTLLISEDIVAVDVAAAKILGVNPDDVYYLKYAEELKIGTTDLQRLQIKKYILPS